MEKARAREILSAHEESHSLLHWQMFFQTLEPSVKEVFQSFPQRITVIERRSGRHEEPPDENRWAGCLNAVARVLEWILDDFNGRVTEKISDVGRKAGDAYDFATDHGRQGPEGNWPSAENQFQAAEEAVQNFKLQARY